MTPTPTIKITALPRTFRQWVEHRTYVAKQRLKRLRRAWAYFTGKLTEDDASWMVSELNGECGYTILETLDTASVLEWAEELFGPHEHMAEWVRDAVRRVGGKWEGSGEIQSAASDWAIDLVREYAAQDGVKLVEIDQ